MRQVIDVENYNLINGGTGSGVQPITGFLGQDGILTHDLTDDPTGTTALDAYEMSIADTRTGAALCEPDLVIAHRLRGPQLGALKTR